MFTKLLKHRNNLILLIVLTLALVVRVYKLDTIPPSLSWDEAANGYNGYVIANYGLDEWGKFLPPYFTSFGDDKHPVHIYITAVFVKFLDLNEFTTRLPSAIFGVFNVYLVFLIAKRLFKKESIALTAALFLAISPYAIQFSRFNHELNFALFFFMLGVVLFYKGLAEKNYLIPLSFLSFFVNFISYHSAKVIVPIILLFLIISSCQQLLKLKTYLFSGLLILFFCSLIIIFNPELLGLARIKQTAISDKTIQKTDIYQMTQNPILGRIQIVSTEYLSHFSPKYLFVSGDGNARHSTQLVGELYLIDGLFLIIGLLALLKRRDKASTFLLLWLLISPLPASLVNEAPHAGRAMFMLGSLNLVCAYGFMTLVNLTKNSLIKKTMAIILLVILFALFLRYVYLYLNVYTKAYAIEWQYGMKDIVEFVKNHPEYDQVFMTDVRGQPYIFFLYHLKQPLPEYLNTMSINRYDNKLFNTIDYFDKYYFGGWDTVESIPHKKVLYIVTPFDYDGLRNKAQFDIKKIIYYPNGLSAFFLVSGFNE